MKVCRFTFFSFSLTAEHLLKVFVLLCACSGSVVQAQLPNILTESVVVDVFLFVTLMYVCEHIMVDFTGTFLPL